MFSKCNFQKSSCLKLQGPELSYLVYSIIKRSSTKVVQIMPLGSKLTGPRGSQFTLNYIRKSSNDMFSLTANGNLTTQQEWSPTKIVKKVLICWIILSETTTSVNGSTVTFDLFLRWATQGPLGPLVFSLFWTFSCTDRSSQLNFISFITYCCVLLDPALRCMLYGALTVNVILCKHML